MMNNFMNWVRTRIAFSLAWFKNNRKAINEVINESINEIGKCIDRIGCNVVRLAIIGVFVNVIAQFYPEFPNRFPIIYGWFDGWLILVEFAFKVALGVFYAIFTGSLSQYWTEYQASFEELWAQFVDWLSQIHF